MATNNIQEFRDTFLKHGMQKPSQFNVQMQGPGMPLFEFQPESVTIPGRELQIHRDELWGPERPIPIKRTFNSAIITVFAVDREWNAKDYIEEWMNKLVTPYSDGNMRQSYTDTIKNCTLNIEAMNNNGRSANATIVVVEPWPQTIMPLDMGHAMFNDYVRMQVSWAYREYDY